MAPLATTLTGSSRRRCAAATKARADLDVLDDGERRIGEHAERDHRHAQQPPERARHVRTEHRAHADGTDSDADAPPDGRRRSSRCRPASARSRSSGSTSASSSGRVGDAARPPVDLDAAAHDDALERPALGRGAEDRRGGVVGQLAGLVGRGPAVGLPHRDVDDDVGIEGGDRLDDAVVVVRRDEVERRPVQTPSRRIDVDARRARRPTAPLRAARRRASRGHRPCRSPGPADRPP